MSTRPWDAGRALDEAMVARVLRRQFPDLSGEVRYLNSGWDNDCYRLGDEWVLRFPRRLEVAERLPIEVAVLKAVAGKLPLASPNVEIEGSPDEEFPYPFIGYRYLEGVPWTPEASFDEESVPRQLGELLGVLHQIPCPSIVPTSEWGPREDLEELQAREQEVLQALAPKLHPFWEEALQSKAAVPVPPPRIRLVHNDLDLEHLLLDQDSGRLLGIIDFADSECGDPARDFAAFVYRFDRWFYRRMLEGYTSEVDAGLWERAWFVAHVSAPCWLADAILSKNPENIRRHLDAIVKHAERPGPSFVGGF